MHIFSIFGIVVALILAALVFLELLGRLHRSFRRTFLEEEFRRQDFLDPRYHVYINWTDTWLKPMFTYVPVGMRVFNADNPIAPVENNSLGFRCPEFDDKPETEFRIVVLGGSAAWGFGASANQTTIAGHLERICDERKAFQDGKITHVKVWNLAQVNQTQTQDIITVSLMFPI